MLTKTRCAVEFEAEKLKRLIQMAKTGIVCQSDKELIEWLEWKLENTTYQSYQADYQEIDIDAIPF
jgi:hypothetical protein